ncbi:DNA uptake protein ComE-like DNA-binding protein [Kordia periserrulae]|uniref:DNA uptake protein ComE-like DNA-binding protein n=1 Tax=Kordia periserrulae TaxID=701523 RepID=A0A2T6C557_9FLAO|nr:helix-hairpin-helix domain-containing protein [Kordia periserrulae]PTX63423.1 DNA uptake protein ComE-like DNA-binding protein [Kordia periserrulae]
MKNIKSHFTFLKAERSGILCIIVLIFLVQGIYFYTNPTTTSERLFSATEVVQYQQQIDSLKLLALNTKPKHYPFNPNFISDYKGFTLGMSTAEIDRLHAFRATNKYVNSAAEFQTVTKVSDSLLNDIKPYFKFPEWVTQKKKKKVKYTSSYKTIKESIVVKKIDINKATIEELRKVYGIGEKLSARIVKYRTKLNGFVTEAQLNDVYGLKPEVIENVWKRFYLEKPIITPINLNTCTLAELLKVPYINYELADEIINQRILREGFKKIEELAKIQNFPSDKLEIIKLYLQIQ